jgi:hypothetical protein
LPAASIMTPMMLLALTRRPLRLRNTSHGKLPASFHHHGLIKPFLALKMITNAGHIGPGAFTDFAEMRSVKACLGE